MNKSLNLLKLLNSNEFLIFVVYLSICISYPQPLFKDPDVAWHASSGMLIRRLGYVPYSDIWTFSSDQIWYNISWLWDVITSYLYEVISLFNISLISDSLHALIVVYAYNTLVKREKVFEDAKNVSVMLLAMVVWEYSSFRPNIISMFFTIFLYAKLRTIKAINYKIFICQFSLLMLIWANCHGGFLIGFILIGIYGLNALHKKNYQRFLILIFAAILGLIAVMINPYGYHIWLAVLRTLNSDISKFIAEWKPFVFGTHYSTSFVLIVVLLICHISIKGSKLSEKLLFYFWLLMALSSVRNFIYFMILGLPHLVNSMGINLPRAYNEKPLSLKIRLIICFGLVIGSVLIRPIMFEKNAYMFDMLPVEEAIFIKENFANKNVLNTYDSGGILIYYGEGSFKHFIDGRAGTAFSEKVLNENLDIFLHTPRWKKLFSTYDINVVLLNRSSLQNKSMSEYFANWNVAYIGRHNIVLSK